MFDTGLFLSSVDTITSYLVIIKYTKLLNYVFGFLDYILDWKTIS